MKNLIIPKKIAVATILQVRLYCLLGHIALVGLLLIGCTDFVDLDAPKNKLVSETIFNDPATVESALANIYFTMRVEGMISGRNGMSTVMGVYSDELDYYGFASDISEFYNHAVTPLNRINSNWWQVGYNLVFSANNIIQGVGLSETLSSDEKAKFIGQALFVRAYMYSLLVSLYGDIPYTTSTDYEVNNKLSRDTVSLIYENIIGDLNEAKRLLSDNEETLIIPGRFATMALLSRMYLYTENWTMAEAIASELIENFTLEMDLNKVFLLNSTESIWALKPGDEPVNTFEANEFVIRQIPGQQFALSEHLLNAFENGDLRRQVWVGTTSSADTTITLRYPNKYKAIFTETNSLEYSVIFRLAEQFLIRAEARTQLGNLSGAQEDLNVIRVRAGLDPIYPTNLDAMMDAILHERQVELFTEHGQRWFDLRRSGSAGEVLADIKLNWGADHLILPIPQSELELNHNLLPQNPGY